MNGVECVEIVVARIFSLITVPTITCIIQAAGRSGPNSNII